MGQLRIENAQPVKGRPALKGGKEIGAPAEAAAEVRKDKVSVGRSAQQMKGQAQRAEEFQRLRGDLERRYPHLTIKIEGLDGEAEDMLWQSAKKPVIFLSKEFMDGLYDSDEVFKRRTRALTECAGRLCAGGQGEGVWLGGERAVFWKQSGQKENKLPSKAELEERQKEDILKMLPSPAEQELNKVRMSPSSYSVSAAYARMAGARNKSAVQTVMQQTRSDISRLKMRAVYGDEKERARARASVRSLQKLLLRGNSKLASLADTELVKQRKKRAHERKEKERELKAALELKKKKTSGAIKDGAIRKEGQLDELNLPGRKEKWEREDYLPLDYVPGAPIFAGTGAPDLSAPAPAEIVGIVEF